MITATVQEKGRSVEIEFPCGDAAMFESLRKIGVDDPLDTTQFVKDCGREISELSALDGKLVNLDFLNFLAKRLESFSKLEERQFQAALSVKKPIDIKDMINLTYHLQNYTLIDSFHDLRDVGKRHFLNFHGCMSEKERSETDFEAVGRQLLDSGKGIVTPYGVVFENGLPEEEIFNGQTFPEYLYSECAYTVPLSHDGRTEFLYLPTEELAIQKAVNRLGAGNIDECKVDGIDSVLMPIDGLFFFCEDTEKLDVPSFNRFSKAVLKFEDSDFEKLTAAAQYADVHGFGCAAQLAENLDSFLCVPGVRNAEELGRYLIRESHEYQYDDRLDGFYNYEMLGNFIAEHQEGEFTDYGYVGVDDPDFTLAEILGRDGADITMGEM